MELLALFLFVRVVHLDVVDCSEELLCQQSYAIKNQLGHLKPLGGILRSKVGGFGYPSWFFMA